MQRQPEKVMDHLFAKLAIKYAHKFTSVFPDEDIQLAAQNEWAEQLSKFSLDQIKKALDVCVDNFPEWPPTVGEFKALCNIGCDNWRTDQLALPVKKAQQGVVEAAIAEMKEILI